MRMTLALYFRGYGRPGPWNSLIRKRWTKLGESRMRWRALPPVNLAGELAPLLRQAENMFHSNRYSTDVLRNTEWLREDWRPPVDLEQKINEIEGCSKAPLQAVPLLSYGWPRRMEGGVNQAALLTNCRVRSGLSPAHQVLVEQSIDEMDSQELRLVQEAVLHAHLWQTDEEHLPRRTHREKLQIVLRAEHGIHPLRIVRYLLENLARLAATATIGAAVDRLEMHQHTLRERLCLWQNTRVHFDEAHDVAIFGTAPLPLLFESPSEAATQRPVYEPLHSMAPISPLVDMQSVECYFEEKTTVGSGLPSSDFLHTHPHLVTLNFALPNTWSDFQEPESRPVTPSHRAGALLMSAYAQAASSARKRFGDKAVDEPEERLPTPIVVQAIGCDGINFDFCCLQLNTLQPCQGDSELDNMNKVRNDCWMDVNNRLVDKVIPVEKTLPETLYRDLQPLVYRKFLSFYRFGVH